MKVGILTYHRSLNFGAMLQATALRKSMEGLGYNTAYIDYWPDHQEEMYRLFKFKRFKTMDIKHKCRYIIHFILILCPELLKRYHFMVFYNKNIKKYLKPASTHFDAIIYGSDQIWRWQNDLIGYNKVYFGDNDFDTNIHIAYGASMGELPQTDEKTKFLLKYIKKLNYIAVREKSLQTYLNNVGVSDIALVLDPTLLLNKTQWDKMINKKKIIRKPYLLLYDLQKTAFDYNEVYLFARKRGLKIINIIRIEKINIRQGDRRTDGPIEFLNLVKYASFVVTSSFHGMVFSILFNKQFLSSFIDNQDRALSLLGELDLMNCYISDGSKLPDNVEDVNWEEVNDRLQKLREFSLNYIIQCLK